MLGNPEVAVQAGVGLPRLPPGVQPQIGGEAGQQVARGLVGEVVRTMVVRLCALLLALGLLVGGCPPLPLSPPLAWAICDFPEPCHNCAGTYWASGGPAGTCAEVSPGAACPVSQPRQQSNCLYGAGQLDNTSGTRQLTGAPSPLRFHSCVLQRRCDRFP